MVARRSQHQGSQAVILLALVVACFSAPLTVFADQRELQQPRAAVDAVLLVDSSGSMLKTDPQMLRYEGAKLLLKFLGAQDRFAIVSFSDKASVVDDLKEFSPTRSTEINSLIEGIKTSGQYSDLLEGIRVAERLFDASPRNDAERIIILLSDGKMEPNPSVATSSVRTVELVNQVLPDLKSKEIKVHTLSFSNQADKVLLGEISATTDGLNWFTESSEEVHKSFADLFLVVKRPQVLPMRSRSFVLDGNVNEATFYITREEGSKLTLVSPKNKEMTVNKVPEWITWFAGKNFDVITLKEPDIGEWQVQGGVSTEGFATVLTNLKLVTDWPVIVRSDQESVVQARLYDGDKPVALPDMAGVITYGFQIVPTDRIAPAVVKDFLNDEGRDGDRIAHDGIFSKKCTISLPGEYKLSIIARGPTFERSQQVPFRVKPRLVNLSVLPGMLDEHGADHSEHTDTEHSTGEQSKGEEPKILSGDQDFIFRAELSKEAQSLKEYDIQLEALSSDRKKTVVAVKKHAASDEHFEIRAKVLPTDGLYALKMILKGTTKKNQEVEGESGVVRFQFKSTAEKEKVEEPTPVPQPKPEPKASGTQNIVQIVLITLANIAAVILGLSLTKKAKSPGPPPTPYSPPKQMLDAIVDLEQRLSASDIKIGDVQLESDSEDLTDDKKEGAQNGQSSTDEVTSTVSEADAEQPSVSEEA